MSTDSKKIDLELSNSVVNNTIHDILLQCDENQFQQLIQMMLVDEAHTDENLGPINSR